MKKALAFMAIAAFATHAHASLIPIGPLASSGNGIGAVNTLLTYQNTGTESGCVAYNGIGDVTGAGACPLGFSGGNESPGGSQNNVFTAADLSFTATRNFSNLVLIFNGNEGGNAADQPIVLNSLALTLYSTTGALLGTFTTAAPFNAVAFPGVGNAGFGFALDAAQAAQANALLASNPLLRIGAAATSSNAQGGPETIQVTTVDDTGVGPSAIPEPQTSVMLVSGLLLIGISALRKRSQA